MEDRDNPGFMLGEPTSMQSVMYESYKDDPYFRFLVDLRPLAEQYVLEHSDDGVTGVELASFLKCRGDVLSGLLVSMLANGSIYYCGDEYKRDGAEVYRHMGWRDGSESFCVVCGSPSHSDCGQE